MADPTLNDVRQNPLVGNFEEIVKFILPDLSGPNDGLNGLMKLLEVGAVSAPVAGKPIVKGLKALGQRGSYKPGQLQELIQRMMRRTEEVTEGVDPARKNVERVSRGLGVGERDPLDALLQLKQKSGDFTDQLIKAKGDMSILTNPSVDARSKKEAFDRLKLNKRISNAALGELDKESQKQVKRAIQLYGNK